jgi:hypothetical protein
LKDYEDKFGMIEEAGESNNEGGFKVNYKL